MGGIADKEKFYKVHICSVPTCPELAWEWEPMLWLLSSLLTLSRVGMLPLLLMLLMVPMVPRLCSFSRLPSPSVSRCSEDEPTTRPWGRNVGGATLIYGKYISQHTRRVALRWAKNR